VAVPVSTVTNFRAVQQQPQATQWS